MNEPYQETVGGELMLRPAPSAGHELLCARLHEALIPLVAELSQLRLLAPRQPLTFSPGNVLRPDLTIVDAQTERPWLCGEVIDAQDHLSDTFHKKTVYEDIRLPRLWMIDPRYQNIEVYKASAFGIVLQEILAQHQFLEPSELPGLRLGLGEFFREES